MMDRMIQNRLCLFSFLGIVLLFHLVQALGREDIAIDQLDIGHRGVIADTITALENTGITTGAVREMRAEVVEKLADDLTVTQAGNRQISLTIYIFLLYCCIMGA